MRKRILPAAVLLLAAACGGNTPFDPVSVQLTGAWTLSVDDNAYLPPPGVVNPCRIRNVPITISVFNADTMAVNTIGSGTISCETNGAWGTSAYTQYLAFKVLRSGATVTFLIAGRPDTIMNGSITSSTTISGTFVPLAWGRTGTWMLSR